MPELQEAAVASEQTWQLSTDAMPCTPTDPLETTFGMTTTDDKREETQGREDEEADREIGSRSWQREGGGRCAHIHAVAGGADQRRIERRQSVAAVLAAEHREARGCRAAVEETHATDRRARVPCDDKTTAVSKHQDGKRDCDTQPVEKKG